jgi:hypothetical protein
MNNVTSANVSSAILAATTFSMILANGTKITGSNHQDDTLLAGTLMKDDTEIPVHSPLVKHDGSVHAKAGDELTSDDLLLASKFKGALENPEIISSLIIDETTIIG